MKPRDLFSRQNLFLAGLFLLLLTLRIPYFMTHHVQEDAYITLRVAETLAETGTYGFNPGERVSASTTHLYVFLAAIVRLIVGRDAFVVSMQVVNTALFLFGAYFIAAVLIHDRKPRLFLWGLISLLPISLLISYSGMETSLLVFVIGGVFYLFVNNKRPWLAWLGIAILPWIRPDAVAYALLLIFWYCVQEKRIKFQPLIALVIGTGSLLLFNQLYFGALLNQSIIAKSLSRKAFTWNEFWVNLRLVFAENAGGIFNPIRTKLTDRFGYPILLLVLYGMITALKVNLEDRARTLPLLCLVSISLAVPAAYALGGVVFPWYMWPSSFCGYILLAFLAVQWASGLGKWLRVLATILAVIVVLLGMTGQWAYAYNWGTKEYAYRGEVGRDLAQAAGPEATLFLEPAGYIPFYSGLKTYDEVGLVSPLIVHYREVYRSRWWMEFVRDAKPDWIVERGHFREYVTYQGYQLDNRERKWFLRNYELVKEYQYQAENYANNPLLLKLLALGEADDYLVYHYVGE